MASITHYLSLEDSKTETAKYLLGNASDLFVVVQIQKHNKNSTPTPAIGPRLQ